MTGTYESLAPVDQWLSQVIEFTGEISAYRVNLQERYDHPNGPLATFETRKRLRVADLRGLEEEHPVLQSARYVYTQAFALDGRHRGLDGILYASAQHANHGCLCLFKSGIGKIGRLSVTPLVSGSQQLHRSVVRAAWGSRVPIDP